jgi:three-Cys-motif partner protein
MAVPKDTIWPIDPHTAAKHVILRAYLNAWLPMISAYNGRVLFIDGFAGPGRYTGCEPGSPIIALTTLLDHRVFQTARPNREFVFYFIEREQARVEFLQEELRRLESKRALSKWAR